MPNWPKHAKRVRIRQSFQRSFSSFDNHIVTNQNLTTFKLTNFKLTVCRLSPEIIPPHKQLGSNSELAPAYDILIHINSFHLLATKVQKVATRLTRINCNASQTDSCNLLHTFLREHRHNV